jgi:hypothetical protein
LGSPARHTFAIAFFRICLLFFLAMDWELIDVSNYFETSFFCTEDPLFADGSYYLLADTGLLLLVVSCCY